MKLKNVLLVVNNLEKSKQFYKQLFGLEVIRDNPANLILMEGLVLQDKALWQEAIGQEVITESNSTELYFEENNIDEFIQKLEKLYPNVKYLTQLTTHPWGQKIIRFYDLDGNLIEVGTAV